MDPSNYFSDGEEALCSASAFMGNDALEKGTLVCTQKRLLFQKNGDIVDIDADRIDAIELTGKEYPEKFGVGAIIASLGAILWMAADKPILNVELPDFLKIVGLGAVGVGILILVVGLLYRTSTLKVHTGASSFEFRSKDAGIQSFPTNLR